MKQSILIAVDPGLLVFDPQLTTYKVLDALSSGVPLNVDLDTTLTVVAGNLYRFFARDLARYHAATADTIWRHFLDDTGTLHITTGA